MQLVNEVKLACDKTEETITKYIEEFSKRGISFENKNKFIHALNIVKTIRDTVNEENQEEKRNSLLDLQGYLDETFLSVKEEMKR